MKSMWKKLMSAAFVLVMTGAVLQNTAQAADPPATNGCVVEDGVLTAYTGMSTVLTIPEGVVRIGEKALHGNENIEIVNLPDSVKYIDDSAFSDCKNLIQVSFPDGLLRIGTHAFGDTSLQEVDLSGTRLEAISDNAFAGCRELLNLSMPDTVKRIGDSTFSGCNNLTTVSLSENLQFIGEHAFSSCERLRFIELPDSVRWMGEYAFSYCESMTEMKIPEGITILPEGVLNSAYDLQSLTLPNTLQIIDKQALNATDGFNYVSPMRELTVPASVVSIWELDSVLGQSGLEHVTVTRGSEGERCFTGFKNANGKEVTLEVREPEEGRENFLPSIVSQKGGDASVYEGKRSDFKIKNGVLLEYKGSESTVIIPEGVTEIGKQAFWKNNYVVRVVLPDSVTKIGPSAFAECGSLLYVTLPEGVTEIGKNAFEECSSLMELNIPEGVTEIADRMCYNCKSLLSVTMGSRVTAIGDSAFSYTPLLTLGLPDSLQSIGKKAFSPCGLRQVELPDSLTSVGESAFFGCKYLTAFSWPGNLTELPQRILEDCRHLREVYLHTGLTSIGNRAFNGCHMLTSLYIPGTVTSIGQDLFANNNKNDYLKTIYGLKGTEAAAAAETYGCSFYALTDEQVTEYEARATVNMPQRDPEKTPVDTKPSAEEKSYVSITSVEGLQGIRNDLDGNYRLDADLNLAGINWQPIGVTAEGRIHIFTGIFDGNGHTITGLTMSSEETEYSVNGLFAVVNGTVKNLTLQDCSISVSNHALVNSGVTYGTVAGAVGYQMDDDSAEISGCRVTGSITFNGDKDITNDEISVGGIVGQILNGRITDCRNESKIIYLSKEVEEVLNPGNHAFGGICGYKQNGYIIHCVNAGAVQISRAVYGLYYDEIKIDGDYVQEIVDSIMGRGEVNLYNYAGGICGYIWGKGEISGCYNTGAVSNKAFITYAGASLLQRRGYTDAGGICARLASGTKITDCYNTGAISSKCNVKEVIQIIADSRFAVDAPFSDNYSYAGGIVGRSSAGLITQCFNLGSVKKGEGKGAVCGIATGNVPLRYCRYLQADGLTGCTKYDDARHRCMPMTTETTQETGVMTTDPETYRGFDFGAKWILVPGMSYPQLLDNMESEVTNFTWKSSALAKTDYSYGESLDASGLTAAFSLEGVEGEIIYDLSADRITGYQAKVPGEQKLSVTLFGNTLPLTVTVGEWQEVPPSEDIHKHDYYKEKVIEATCTEAKKTVYTCYYCDDTYEKPSGKAKGHDYQVESIENGITKYVCSVCGDSYESDPSASANPNNPADPANPDNPSDPANPDNPSGPANPDNSANPSDPANPADPSGPANPANPADPTNPDNPADSTNPDNPSDPANPADPSDPANPHNPTNPANPDSTAGPGNPASPANPANSANPAGPAGPNNPGSSANSAVTASSNGKQSTGSKTVALKKAVLKSLKAQKGRKLKVSWKRDKSSTGYEIQYSQKKNFKGAKRVLVKGNKNTSTVIKKLKKGKKYYVRIRVYRQDGSEKAYGAYSKVKSAKVK